MADPDAFTEDPHADAAGWTLGILDHGESGRFELHLESCRQCQQVVADFGPAALMLATAASLPEVRLADYPEPPSGLLTRTLSRVQQAASGNQRTKTPWRRWTRRRALAAAAVAAAAAVTGVVLLLMPAAPALAFTIALHPQHGGTASGHATAHHTDDGWSVMLTVYDMPVLGPGQFYECWYAGPGNSPGRPYLITAGTFTVPPGGSATAQMWSAADPRAFPEMEITREAAGDAGQHGQVLLSGTAQK